MSRHGSWSCHFMSSRWMRIWKILTKAICEKIGCDHQKSPRTVCRSKHLKRPGLKHHGKRILCQSFQWGIKNHRWWKWWNIMGGLGTNVAHKYMGQTGTNFAGEVVLQSPTWWNTSPPKNKTTVGYLFTAPMIICILIWYDSTIISSMIIVIPSLVIVYRNDMNRVDSACTELGHLMNRKWLILGPFSLHSVGLWLYHLELFFFWTG